MQEGRTAHQAHQNTHSMDPLSITIAVVTIVGGAAASYEEITSFIDAINRAPKEVEDIRTDSGNIYNIISNLRDALEEGEIRDVISIDNLAQKHVRDLERPLFSPRRPWRR